MVAIFGQDMQCGRVQAGVANTCMGCLRFCRDDSKMVVVGTVVAGRCFHCSRIVGGEALVNDTCKGFLGCLPSRITVVKHTWIDVLAFLSLSQTLSL